MSGPSSQKFPPFAAHSPPSVDHSFMTRGTHMDGQTCNIQGREARLTPQSGWKDESLPEDSPGNLSSTEMNLYLGPLWSWRNESSALISPPSDRNTYSRSVPPISSYMTAPYRREDIAVSTCHSQQLHLVSDNLIDESSMLTATPRANEPLMGHRLPYTDNQPDLNLWPGRQPDHYATPGQALSPPTHGDRINCLRRPRHVNERDTSTLRVKKPITQRRPTSAPGRRRRRETSSAAKSDDSSTARLFVCIFARYGCESTFSTKNEWKRHITSQHLQLGFYRCDVGRCNVDSHPFNFQGLISPIFSPRLCTTSPFPGQPNDFNRKDLFTQHQRRMHAPWFQSGKRRNPTDAEHAAFETGLDEVRQRCWHELRQPPLQGRCGVCGETFWGERSWEARMEHDAWHLERGERENRAGDTEDEALREWGLREGILVLVEGKCGLASLVHDQS